MCESVSRGPTKNIVFCPVGDKSVHSFHEPPARRTSATRALTVAKFAAMWYGLADMVRARKPRPLPAPRAMEPAEDANTDPAAADDDVTIIEPPAPAAAS